MKMPVKSMFIVF